PPAAPWPTAPPSARTRAAPTTAGPAPTHSRPAARRPCTGRAPTTPSPVSATPAPKLTRSSPAPCTSVASWTRAGGDRAAPPEFHARHHLVAQDRRRAARRPDRHDPAQDKGRPRQPRPVG